MIIVSGIRIPLDEDKTTAGERARKLLGLARGDVEKAVLHRVSCDARHGCVFLVCSVALELGNVKREAALAEKYSFVKLRESFEFCPTIGGERLSHRPVIVGFGPAGIFAADILAKYGYRPLVIERGPDADVRTAAVNTFFSGGAFDENANVQFGEGGAGTFSDGKLTTRIGDARAELVLQTLHSAGAPESILYEAKPHLGTDELAKIVKTMRQRMTENGAEVRFCERLTDIKIENGALRAAVTDKQELPAEALVLASGHSATDVFHMLASNGAALEAKPFSVGMRIEHLRTDVEKSLYGGLAGDPRLPAGEYALSAHIAGRGVYTFCMCPGGTVVAAASEDGGVVTNGMSVRARDGKNSNAAVCAAVSARDFGSDIFAGLEFQRRIERAAFGAGGGDFSAPGADAGSFMRGETGLGIGKVEPTYPRGLRAADMNALFGMELCDALRGGISVFSKKLRCYGDESAILTAPETRTSSPVRITRNESGEAEGIRGLYPAGEGAGYAGGIVSAAVDGIRAATAVMARFRP